ncbi:MAG: hypothetical protein GF311_19570 [Candidatus Lokiarchaeota archaeon]|nr:hypothetical protein [Candidatus Lokiarchaeota archaeon]
MNLKIELSRQTDLIISILAIYFVFFGYICNTYGKSIGFYLIFLNRILFNPTSYLSSLILAGIVFFMVIREDFFQYGIRNAIWLTPIVLGLSCIWFWIINGFNISIVWLYFITLDGWITILSILGINITTALLASYVKLLLLKRKKELDKIQNFKSPKI